MPRKEVSNELRPHWTTADGKAVRIYFGDSASVLRRMPARSVHCAITSPPYWALRSYETGDSKHLELGSEPSPDCGTHGQAQCGRCFVCAMVRMFREVRRVLRDDGTLWLNLGDSYSGGAGGGRNDADRVGVDGFAGSKGKYGSEGIKQKRNTNGQGASALSGLSSGNLVGVPWRVALALQADGWVLRQDIIWQKPAPMPESVRNRCTKAHEYVFLLTKSMDYFYDAEAIKEVGKVAYASGSFIPNSDKDLADVSGSAATRASPYGRSDDLIKGAANKRSVWTVSSQGYPGSHFATYPPKLIEPMILAGTSEAGCCAACGAPVERVVERKSSYHHTTTADGKNKNGPYANQTGDGEGTHDVRHGVLSLSKTTGWLPSCRCNIGLVFHRLRDDVPSAIMEDLKSLGFG